MKTTPLHALPPLRPWLKWLLVWAALIVLPPNLFSGALGGPLWNADLIEFQWRLAGGYLPLYLFMGLGVYGSPASPEWSEFMRVAMNTPVVLYAIPAFIIGLLGAGLGGLLRLFLKITSTPAIGLGISLSLLAFQTFSLWMLYRFGTAGP